MKRFIAYDVTVSYFTLEGHELPQSLLVNPHDIDGMVAAMDRALRMAPAEVKNRMAAMRRTVFNHDVYAWVDAFMSRLRSLRRPGRTLDRRQANDSQPAAVAGVGAGSREDHDPW